MEFKKKKKKGLKNRTQTGNRYLLKIKISAVFLTELTYYSMFTDISPLE